MFAQLMWGGGGENKDDDAERDNAWTVHPKSWSRTHPLKGHISLAYKRRTSGRNWKRDNCCSRSSTEHKNTENCGRR
jgi:hypothetical protein